MDGAEVLRAARRRARWDQRTLAARSGVAASTIAAIEAGRRTASLPVLTAVLAAVGLELTVDLAPPPLEEGVHRHLHRSLASRLHLACGGDGRPDGRPDRRSAPPAWDALQDLAARHAVHLHGRTAVAMWLPLASAAEQTPVVCARPTGAYAPAAGRPDLSRLDLRTGCTGHEPSPVRIPLVRGQVTADPPADLALDPEHAEHRGRLRAVAALLHAQAPVDAAGRRVRAHTDPDHVAERHQVFHDRRFAPYELPSRTDVRSWRLDDDASLAAWLRRQGYPT